MSYLYKSLAPLIIYRKLNNLNLPYPMFIYNIKLDLDSRDIVIKVTLT
jgi:hypothetical protein